MTDSLATLHFMTREDSPPQMTTNCAALTSEMDESLLAGFGSKHLANSNAKNNQNRTQD